MFAKSAIDRLRYYDWTFSNTAEQMVALRGYTVARRGAGRRGPR
jgi:hypothetical protein